MPETPGAYRQRYYAISFQGCIWHETIRIDKYRSSFRGDDNTREVREASYNDLRRFITRRRRYNGGANGAEHSWEGGVFKSDLLQGDKAIHVDLKQLQAMFQGVGRPQDFKTLFRLIDVYLTKADIDDKHFQDLGWTKFGWDMVPFRVKDYAEKLLGVDCRGFVGAYLRDNYPNIRDTRNDMSFSIDSYNKGVAHYNDYDKSKAWGRQFTRIDKPSEIKQGDLLVKCQKGGGNRHVAIVDSAGASSSMGVHITTAESRGRKGLCTLSGELRRLQKAHLTGQDDKNWSHCGTHFNFVLRPKA